MHLVRKRSSTVMWACSASVNRSLAERVELECVCWSLLLKKVQMENDFLNFAPKSLHARKKPPPQYKTQNPPPQPCLQGWLYAHRVYSSCAAVFSVCSSSASSAEWTYHDPKDFYQTFVILVLLFIWLFLFSCIYFVCYCCRDLGLVLGPEFHPLVEVCFSCY